MVSHQKRTERCGTLAVMFHDPMFMLNPRLSCCCGNMMNSALRNLVLHLILYLSKPFLITITIFKDI